MDNELTHINEQGRAHMVDVGDKASTQRTATARCRVQMLPQTLERIRLGGITKGDVLAVAQVAGIQAAKKTWDLIPMCHPIALTSVDITFAYLSDEELEIRGTAKTSGQTGVEMEALTAVCVAALTVYDMCKAIDRGMTIRETALVHKSGGKSGEFLRE